MDLGRVWGGIWEDFDVFVEVVAKFWGHLEKHGPAAAWEGFSSILGDSGLLWINASLLQLSSPFVPFPLMAVLRRLRAGALLLPKRFKIS